MTTAVSSHLHRRSPRLAIADYPCNACHVWRTDSLSLHSTRPHAHTPTNLLNCMALCAQPTPCRSKQNIMHVAARCLSAPAVPVPPAGQSVGALKGSRCQGCSHTAHRPQGRGGGRPPHRACHVGQWGQQAAEPTEGPPGAGLCTTPDQPLHQGRQHL
jgi:hypothetical protein